MIGIDTPDHFIDNLLATGFERKKQVKEANLEDVFISMTGKNGGRSSPPTPEGEVIMQPATPNDY